MPCARVPTPSLPPTCGRHGLSPTSAVRADPTCRQVKGTVVAEVRTNDTVAVVDQIRATSSHPLIGICSTSALHNILTLAALRPTLGAALSELTSFYGQNFIIEGASAHVVGMEFGALPAYYPLAIVCGLQPKGRPPVLAPPAATRVRPSDRIVFVARDRKELHREGDATARRRHPMKERCATTKARRAFINALVGSITPADGLEQPTAAPDDAMDVAEAGTVLIIGWRSGREIASMIMTIDALVPPGTEIINLSEVPSAVRSAAVAAETDSSSKGLGCKVTYVEGPPMSQKQLEQLPLDGARAAIVVADPLRQLYTDLDDYSEEVDRVRDARVYAVATMLRRGAPKLHIVSVFGDVLTHRLFQKTPGLVPSNPALAFHRNAIETGLLAMQATEASLKYVFNAILGLKDSVRAETAGMAVRSFQEMAPVLGFTAPKPRLSFEELAVILLEKTGAVLLGFRQEGDRQRSLPSVNPPHKPVLREWERMDELVLLLGTKLEEETDQMAA